MKAELESKSIELMSWLEQAIKTTSDFTAREVPLFIQELLLYNFVMSLIWFIFGVVLILVGVYALYSLTMGSLSKKECFENNRYIPQAVVATVFVAFGMFIGIPIATNNIDWIKIKVAPRVYLLDYARETFKK